MTRVVLLNSWAYGGCYFHITLYSGFRRRIVCLCVEKEVGIYSEFVWSPVLNPSSIVLNFTLETLCKIYENAFLFKNKCNTLTLVLIISLSLLRLGAYCRGTMHHSCNISGCSARKFEMLRKTEEKMPLVESRI